MTEPDTDDVESTTVQEIHTRREHTRTLDSALSFMDLSEHVTWLLDDAVDGAEYPMEVAVTIEVREVDDGQ